MALYRRFRAVEARDGGCPECREQRYSGLGAPLEERGHGDGPVIYYQCRLCLALWEETLREAHIVWDRLLACRHLQALERELRASGVAIELETKDWSKGDAAGFWLYFRARIDPDATRRQFHLPEGIEYDEWDGRVAGSEAGFHCTSCNSGVMGVHPAAAAGYPTFPTNMDVPPLRDHGRAWEVGEPERQPRSLLRDLAPLLGFLALFVSAIAFGWWMGMKR
jgi:hypothetical protein